MGQAKPTIEENLPHAGQWEGPLYSSAAASLGAMIP
jgi:hypothetical protein